MRKKIVAGNWKMNKTLDEALALTSEVVNMIKDEVTGDVEVVLCVPSLYLIPLNKYVDNAAKVSLGAQNCHEKASGAFTGEISASMLKSVGSTLRHHRPQRAAAILRRIQRAAGR